MKRISWAKGVTCARQTKELTTHDNAIADAKVDGRGFETLETAMLGYVDQQKSLVGRYSAARILDLGAGRWPSFGIAEMPSTVRSYAVHDINTDELEC